MTEATYRATVVFLLSAGVFCLALMATSVAPLAPGWQTTIASGLIFIGAIGMAAAAVLYFLDATAGRAR